MKKLLGILLVVFLASPLFATIYYVDKTTGNDGDDGESEGNAWETVNKVNISSFNAGDIIKFKKGEIWREQLIIPSSGAGETYITFTYYGDGDAPVLNGTNLMDGVWTDEGGNEWSITCTPDPHLVFMDGTLGTEDATPDAEFDWYWDTNELFIWCDNVGGPTAEYTSPGVEATAYPAVDGQGLLYIVDKDYININGLKITQSQENGVDIRTTSNYITIENCESSWCWHSGISAQGVAGSTNITIKDNVVHDVEIIGVTGYNEAVTVSYITTFEISGNTVYNYGTKEGIDAKEDTSDGQIFDNVIYDGRVGIYIDSAYDIDVYRNEIYNQAWQGILLSNEMDQHACDNIDVYNNVIYDVSDGIKYYAAGGSANDISNIDVYNNTIYGCDQSIKFNANCETKYSGTNNMKNNIFWALGANWAILDESASEVGISATSITHNGFRTGANTETSGTNSVTTLDGKFTNPGGDDYHLDSDSPFLDVGTNLGGLVDDDYDGNVRPQNSIWDMGSYERLAGAVLRIREILRIRNILRIKEPELLSFSDLWLLFNNKPKGLIWWEELGVYLKETK